LARSAIRSHTLVTLHQNSSDLVRLEARAPDGLQEDFKSSILLPITVRKWRVDNRRIKINDPRFLAREATGLLGSERSSMESALVADNPNLLRAANCLTIRPCQFDRALSRFRTGG